MASPPRASFAPASSSLAPSTSPTTSRARSLPRRPSQGNLGTPARSSGPVPPTPALPSSSLNAPTASPHYTTSLRSRHSLYGTEDRVVLDLGSSVWKVGFSGEPQPRACEGVGRELARERARAPRGARAVEETELWGLEKGEPSEEEWEVREERVKRLLRRMWFENLMTDPKTRKVIVLENPLLPNRVKEMIARILFDNLQIPAMSFASTPILALMGAGAVTGLVVDVGHLETTALPIFHSRPLFPLLTTTPRAGSRLNRRLRTLLLAFGSYAPPPSSLNSMTPPSIGRIPRDILTDELVEEIKTRLCFVGEAVPPSTPDEGRPAREASSASGASASAMSLDTAVQEDPSDPDAALLQHLYARYAASAEGTTDVSFRVPNLSQPPVPSGVGRGWVQVPGWVRERAAEVLWEEGGEEDGEGEESGLAGVVLDCLLKLPIDLRKPLASSILVIGGTAMMPGFFPRFKSSLLAQLERSHPPSPPPSPPLPPSVSSTADDPMDTTSPAPPPTTSDVPAPDTVAKHRRRRALTLRLHTLRHSPRWAPLAPLAPHLAILNHPSPAPTPSGLAPASSLAREREGAAPAFAPALRAWVGGSLAGALKVGGEEVSREEWDAAGTVAGRGGEEEGEWEEEELARRRRGARLPDWTRLA